jgi:predicted Rdx family selenoprotein
MTDGRVRETSITLTPVGDGRFEVYLDDVKVYDRSEAGSGDFYPSLRELRKIRPKLLERLENAVAVPA